MVALEDLSWKVLLEELRALQAKAGAPATQADQLVHELHVHQVELEMQNRELREVQARLEESQAHYAELYDRAPVGYVTLDANGVITQTNLTAASLLQRERRQLADAPLAALVRDGKGFLTHLREAAQSQALTKAEVELKTAQGFAPAELRTVPCASDAGEITGFRMTIQDVTERRRGDAERAALDAERRARLAAEAENHMKDQFLGIVSHELRTPLAALLGWTSLVGLRANNPAFVARGVHVLRRNGEMLAKLVDDILDVSRIVSGKLHIETKPTSVNEAVVAALDLAGPAALAGQITLQPSLEPDCVVLGDAMRLEQVVSNLLANAVKFTRNGGHVEVTLAKRGSAIQMVVRDDGCGIEASELPHVFEYFRQADSTATRSHPGLGLGLAIARHIVEAHGGTIRARSAGRDRGAEFSIRAAQSVRVARAAAARERALRGPDFHFDRRREGPLRRQ